jgi:hypothetical protein
VSREPRAGRYNQHRREIRKNQGGGKRIVQEVREEPRRSRVWKLEGGGRCFQIRSRGMRIARSFLNLTFSS